MYCYKAKHNLYYFTQKKIEENNEKQIYLKTTMYIIVLEK